MITSTKPKDELTTKALEIKKESLQNDIEDMEDEGADSSKLNEALKQTDELLNKLR